VSIQSIERAAAILRVLAAGQRRLGVSELAERLGLAKGTVHGLLRTLQTEGFVEQDAESGKYQLGASLLQLASSYLDVNELHGGGVLIVHHVFRPDNSLQILEVGAHLPLHATALGKALLAHHEPVAEALLAAGMPRLTKATIVAPAALSRTLRGVRENGWAAEREEAIIGEASIAAAIFDRAGEAAGAIGIAGAVERIYGGRAPRAQLVAEVRDAARAVTRELGGPRR
jgi:DNA-binding IclR family transcriptional regulator